MHSTDGEKKKLKSYGHQLTLIKNFPLPTTWSNLSTNIDAKAISLKDPLKSHNFFLYAEES